MDNVFSLAGFALSIILEYSRVFGCTFGSMFYSGLVCDWMQIACTATLNQAAAKNLSFTL